MRSSVFALAAFYLSVFSAFAGEKPDHIFLLIGQSNMVGRAALEAGDDTEIPGVLLWNGESWESAKPGFNRYSTHRKPGSVQGMNPGVGFVQAYREAHPDQTVGVICWARGGTSIEQWHPDHDEPFDLYDEALRQTRAALEAGGELKGILWHQGESNSSRSAKYGAKLIEHVERLREDLEDEELPFVFSQLGRWKESYAAFNDMIVELPDEIPHSACVTSEGLLDFDNTHLDRASQLEQGRRFAVAMLGLLED